MSQNNKPQKKESMLANLLLNIVIPTLILMKGSENPWVLDTLTGINSGIGEFYQTHGIKLAIVVALAFPILYGLHDFKRAGKVNMFSALGVFSILLTGGISLLELDPQYIAIKEAAIPGILGLVTVLSLKTRFPLVKTFLYNDKILRVDRISEALQQRNSEAAFEQSLKIASWLVAASFFLSSILNYALAKWIIVSPAGTAAFNEELGKMTALSFPVISIPATIVMMVALFYLFRSIKKLTGLTLEDVIVEQ
ncbi:MFS transporter [Oceaniserpentilla sp. 4NH20-0058]|uniref:VC0807 family protein n=1 Tax=Oceaniserpentilla sp. 4NH20-0058 TaxID=3127660 RepID=UPI00310337FA